MNRAIEEREYNDELFEVHPGEILLEDYMKPNEISQSALARGLKIPVTRVNEIVNGARGITPETAIRLGKFFGTSAEFWWTLQTTYEMDRERRKFEESGEEIEPYVWENQEDFVDEEEDSSDEDDVVEIPEPFVIASVSRPGLQARHGRKGSARKAPGRKGSHAKTAPKRRGGGKKAPRRK